MGAIDAGVGGLGGVLLVPAPRSLPFVRLLYPLRALRAQSIIFPMMQILDELIERCPNVESTVNYLDEMDELPVFYAQKQDNNLKLSTHRIVVHDARPVQSRLSLDREGFRLVKHSSATVNFRDSDEVQRVYRPEIEQLIADLTGAPKVIATGAVLRFGERSDQSGRAAQFAPRTFRPCRLQPQVVRRFCVGCIWRMPVSKTPNAGSGAGMRHSTSGACCLRHRRMYRSASVPRRARASTDVVTGLAVIDPPNAPELRFESSLYRFNPGASLVLFFGHAYRRSAGVQSIRLRNRAHTRLPAQRVQRPHLPRGCHASRQRRDSCLRLLRLTCSSLYTGQNSGALPSTGTVSCLSLVACS